MPQETFRYGRPKSVVPLNKREKSTAKVGRKAARSILRDGWLFAEDVEAAAIYEYELNFHNQLKARRLEHRIVVQVIRETTLAPDDFKKSNGMPLRQLQDRNRSWNLATTFFQSRRPTLKLGTPRPGVWHGNSFQTDATGPETSMQGANVLGFRRRVSLQRRWSVYSRVNNVHLTQDKARD